MLVTLISHIELENEHPKVLEFAEEILSTTTKFTKEDQHMFVESSTYPDDIKAVNQSAFNHWHFNDHFFYEDG